MSTYVYFECLEHDPPLKSDREISQHWDFWVEKATRMAQGLEPLPADAYSLLDHFEQAAAVFLAAHHQCAVGLVSEYGEHRAIPGRGVQYARAALERQLLRARERLDVANREVRLATATIHAAEHDLELMNTTEGD